MTHMIMPDGQALYVRQFGRGQPVLILSGLGMHSWQWLPILAHLRDQYRFIIPDWRGFGGSKHCQINSDIDAIRSHWQDLNSVVTQLKLEQVKVVAYSMGASTCLHGIQYGDFSKKISAYLHIDQSPKIQVDSEWPYGLFGRHQTEFKTMLGQMLVLLKQYPTIPSFEQLPHDARQAIMKHWSAFLQFQSRGNLLPKLFKIACQNRFLQGTLLPTERLDHLTWYLQNYLDHKEDYRAALASLKCPVTFFIGVKSLLYPLQGQEIIANSVANSQRVYFEKSGHGLLLTEPRKFSREIARFLAQS